MKNSASINISPRQLRHALKAYDLAIESLEALIESVRNPTKNRADENRELAGYRKRLKVFQEQKKQLEKLQ
jgi:hypothetical protein